MATISVAYSALTAQIDPSGDEAGRVLIGSAAGCQNRLQAEGVLPVHAYLAGLSSHYCLFLAPGASLVCNGRLLADERPLADETDLAHFRRVARDQLTVELVGAKITVHHVGG
jgi:hypothetical protein